MSQSSFSSAVNAVCAKRAEKEKQPPEVTFVQYVLNNQLTFSNDGYILLSVQGYFK